MNVRVDGELKEIFHGMKLDRYKMHSIEVVIDKMIVSEADERRFERELEDRHEARRWPCADTGCRD